MQTLTVLKSQPKSPLDLTDAFLIKPFQNLSPLKITLSNHLIDAIQFETTNNTAHLVTASIHTEHADILTMLTTWFEQYKKGDPLSYTYLPLNWQQATSFQTTVWQKLPEIAPYGKTISYGEASRVITGDAHSARAIGMAMNKNLWHVVIPCHRVVGTQGQLTGYAGGLDIKKALLLREQSAQ